MTLTPDVEASTLAASEEMDKILTSTLATQLAMRTTTSELVLEILINYVTGASRTYRDLLETQEFPQVEAAE